MDRTEKLSKVSILWKTWRIIMKTPLISILILFSSLLNAAKTLEFYFIDVE